MAATQGRVMKLKKNGTAVAGLQTKSLSYAGEPVDITGDDDSGFRTLASFPGVETLDISAEGVTKNTTLRALCLNAGGTLQASDWTFVLANGDTISGNFNIVSYGETGAHNDAEKFTVALQSSGEWTYTVA